MGQTPLRGGVGLIMARRLKEGKYRGVSHPKGGSKGRNIKASHTPKGERYKGASHQSPQEGSEKEV